MDLHSLALPGNLVHYVKTQHSQFNTLINTNERELVAEKMKLDLTPQIKNIWISPEYMDTRWSSIYSLSLFSQALLVQKVL